ncbi:MAG: nitroreductase family protein [Kiritimatiellaeota bacterium]|nr:nitroreductase family protein [Kiritimatiellota bacterium]
MKKLCMAFTALAAVGAWLIAQEAGTEKQADKAAVVKLPEPDKSGGKPLMQALNERKSSRAFSEKDISMETLSSLLWAGFGVNRPDGKRTAPTARNSQDITIYLLTPKGAFMYDAKANTLVTRSETDHRDAVITQAWGKKAPLMLLIAQTTQGEPTLWGAMHAGSIYQNVSLFNASEGLGDVVVGTYNAEAAKKAVNLPDNQRIIIGQIIGYPQ